MNDEMEMDRLEAERLPCTEPKCAAEPGERCRLIGAHASATHATVSRQAAHLSRLRAAGRLPAPRQPPPEGDRAAEPAQAASAPLPGQLATPDPDDGTEPWWQR